MYFVVHLDIMIIIEVHLINMPRVWAYILLLHSSITLIKIAGLLTYYY